MGVRMGRGRRSVLDELTVLPWPVGLVVGVLGFALIRYGVPAWASRQPGLLAQAVGQNDAFATLAWVVLAGCALVSLFSWLDARRKRRLLDAQTGLASIAALGWQDFERLMGEAFRRRGYTVEESGLGGADGGIDLILRKDGRRTLVQCKQWRRRKVPVNVVREMYGLLSHHGGAHRADRHRGRLHARCRALRAGQADHAHRRRHVAGDAACGASGRCGITNAHGTRHTVDRKGCATSARLPSLRRTDG